MLYQQWVVRHLKTLKNLTALVRTKNERELIILSSALLSLVSGYFIFDSSLSFQAHYFLGVVKSFIISSLIFQAFLITKSVRLFGLMLFCLTDMVFDVLCLMSNDLYWLLKPLRYEGSVNVAKTFLAYELFCILTSSFGILRPACVGDRVVISRVRDK